MMNYDEHLTESKKRAVKALETKQPYDVFVGFVSDLKQHPDLENHIGIEMGMMFMMGGNLSTSYEMGKFINGFN